MQFNIEVRTRFAPSPTGVLHLGSVRTALFCWLYARHTHGQFILRIEDTDRERSTQENVDAILDGLAWLGLDFDEGPVFQSERYTRYAEVIENWLRHDKAYLCYCTKEELGNLREKQLLNGERVRYDGRCRGRTKPRAGVDPVVRFKNPLDGKVIVNDTVKGRVEFENAQLDDLIIARSDRTPTYNFTVVVDDFDMKISHVIRGDDHLNNTPRQLNMLEALGGKPPVYVHLPMILGQDGAKLSKRHGAVDVREYREQGYLPEAVLNYLVRLGWSHGDQEVFTTDEMIGLFDICDVNRSASSFNPEKLLWLNQQHMKATSPDKLGAALMPFLKGLGLDPADGPNPIYVAEGFHERADTLLHMASSARYCYEDFDVIDEKSAKKHLRPVVLDPLVAVKERLGKLEHWGRTAVHEVIEEVATDYDISLGKLGQPVRVAVTGGPVSPPIDVTLWLVGRERTVKRLEHAIDLIKIRSGEYAR
jgi:glutamyl-tRNA synthetase